MTPASTSSFQAFHSTILDQAGLNCHAVFDLHRLPKELRDAIFEVCPEAGQYSQLWMFANGGPQFWEAFCTYRQQHTETIDHPMDNFARETVAIFLQEQNLNRQFQFIYPGPYVLNLQSLGRLIGWHHDTPLKIGLHPFYGLWFAYRVVVLVNADWPTTPLADSESISPCQTCVSKACISRCLAGAVAEVKFNLDRCVDYRVQENSSCMQRCVSREACPVAPEHRYSEEQIHFHYAQSWNMLKAFKSSKSP